MLTFTDDEFKRSVQDDTGIECAEARRGRAPVDRPHPGEPVHPAQGLGRGFVYEVETGRLREVDAGPAQSRFRREPAEDRVTS